MEHKFLKNFDKNGIWTKEDRTIRIQGVEHDMDEYAKEHGIELPDSKSKPKKQVNIDIQEEEHADMENKDHAGATEIDGNGNSEG